VLFVALIDLPEDRKKPTSGVSMQSSLNHLLTSCFLAVHITDTTILTLAESRDRDCDLLSVCRSALTALACFKFLTIKSILMEILQITNDQFFCAKVFLIQKMFGYYIFTVLKTWTRKL